MQQIIHKSQKQVRTLSKKFYSFKINDDCHFF